MEVRKSLKDIVMFASVNYRDPFWFCDRLYIKAEPWENEDGGHGPVIKFTRDRKTIIK